MNVVEGDIVRHRVGAAIWELRTLPLWSLFVVSLFLALALFADVLAPHNPLEINAAQIMQPPVFWGGSWSYVLGTDNLGRDLLSRIMFGARSSLIVAAFALVLGTTAGMTIGIVSGYAGGKVDVILMRLTDLTLSFPVILFALLLTVVFGPSFANVVIAIAFLLWARFARLVRGQTLAVRELGYVDLAQVAGASPMRILWTHILPNVVSPVLVLASLEAGRVILMEASLSFLGAGLPPPQPAWGSMTAYGRGYFEMAWWISTIPALMIMFVVLSLNTLGDWVRDRLDPRVRSL